jgi:hypothetical protein
MIFLTGKRQKALEQIVATAIAQEGWHYENVVLDCDQSEPGRIKALQGAVQDELNFYFHRRPWWKFWDRPKKCKPAPCPPWENVNLEVSDEF